MKFKNKILISIIFAYCGGSHSADLIEVWRGVSQHDPEISAALSAKLAGTEKRNQALSLWLPNVYITGTSGKMNSSSETQGANFTAPAPLGTSSGVGFNTSIKDGTSNACSVQARQPIFSQERLAHTKQLNLGADATELEWTFTTNELMLRTAQRYFEVVLITKKLALLKSEYEAIKIETLKAHEKFKLGELPIIDTQEAYALEQDLLAEIIFTENELQVAKYVLSDTSRIQTSELNLKSPRNNLLTFDTLTLNDWVEKAKQSNSLLKLMQAKAAIANQEVKSLALTASSSLDLIAQSAQQKLTGNGDFGAASNSTLQQMVGIQLTIPLFTGRYTSSKHDEAIKLEEKAKYDLDSAQMKITQSVQSSWMALASGQSRIKALTAGLTASNSKLEATKLAQEVGDRTTLDLVNAVNAKKLVEINLMQAKIDYLINQLNLYALAGELDVEKLSLINSQLEM